MTKKALKRLMDAIEARTRGGKNFSGGFSAWVSLKMRPTQFNSSKNFPAGPRPYWYSEKVNAELVAAAGEPDVPAPTA